MRVDGKKGTSTQLGERVFWIPVIDQALKQYERSLERSSLVQNLSASQLNSGFIDQACCSLIWEEATRLADDPLFGMRLHRVFCPTPINAIALTAQACPNLGAAVNNMTRFFSIVSTQVKLEIRAVDDVVEIILIPQGAPHAQHLEALTGYMSRLVNQLDLDEEGLLKNITLGRTHADTDLCARVLEAVAVNTGEHYSLQLKRELMDKPLATADSFLLPRFTEAMQDLLANMPSNDLVEQVKRRIHILLGSGDMSEERVAAPMNISPRHLRRKLSQEGTSYEQLVDEVRRDSAIRMISEGQLSLTSIAYELGFLDPSSFTRAFRRWTDMSPTAFKRQLLAP
ncbi:AraC family transcriptional regulator [Halopseudomonas pelagia]|uniref:AraC family transcriptional regulator n=1 Tax=Halopseudomonas pelagia TaxID=553151 RepID=UPI00039D8DBD|nr:AraC family transcriptional regulator [Halopseudomonas pelagia]|tara:strand:+ start:550 stop:1572 length:1023 start_codon:yes stop_codon:yes gene_type:complete